MREGAGETSDRLIIIIRAEGGRPRLPRPKDQLDWLRHALEQAGNPQLIAPELMTTLAEHAAGNLRVLTTMGNELLAAAAGRDIRQLDQKPYLEVFLTPPRSKTKNLQPTIESRV